MPVKPLSFFNGVSKLIGFLHETQNQTKNDKSNCHIMGITWG